jgi:hypothetical protein
MASWISGLWLAIGGAVIAEVDIGPVAVDALAGDAGLLEAADEFFGLAGEYGASVEVTFLIAEQDFRRARR